VKITGFDVIQIEFSPEIFLAIPMGFGVIAKEIE
jgi:hypothetical protein